MYYYYCFFFIVGVVGTVIAALLLPNHYANIVKDNDDKMDNYCYGYYCHYHYADGNNSNDSNSNYYNDIDNYIIKTNGNGNIDDDKSI